MYPPSLPTQIRSISNRRAHNAAHWGRESLANRLAKCLCSCLLTLILIVGVVFFILWLSLRPHRPRFQLMAFAAPGIASLTNSSFTFNVTDRNSNQNIGIYYDTMYGSVYYENQLIGSGPVLFPFYQPTKNTTAIVGQLGGVTVSNKNVVSRLSADVASGRVALRLELTSTIRFKVEIWDSHQHHLHVECDLYIGEDGGLLPESRGIKCPRYF